MKIIPNKLVFVCGAGAQLSWLYAWGTFLIFTSFQRLYPLPETIGIFTLAVFLTLFSRARGWRVIQVIVVQLVALAVAFLRVIKVFYYPLEPLWHQAWVSDFFSRPREQVEWFLLVFISVYTVVFWVVGICFALQKKSYTSACSRFDRGVIAFFCLFLIKLLMQTRMNIEFHDSIPVFLVFPFFIFGLTEIGLVRSQYNDQPSDYLSGYYAVGVLASFAIGALILGTAIFMFFLPHLKMASGVGYDLIKSAARPLAPILIAMIRFFFSYAKSGPGASELSSSMEIVGMEEPQELSTWMKVLMWGNGLLVVLAMAVVFGLILWYSIRWLFQRRVEAQEGTHQWNLLSWWQRLKAFLQFFYEWILRTASKKSALEFYAALRRWGQNSGLPHESSETPLEYGSRLARHFLQLKPEIMIIVEMLHCEVYGESLLNPEQVKMIQGAWRKLHSPLRWPYRLKAFFNSIKR